MQRMLTVDEAAGALRQSKYTIRAWIRRGRLPACRVGQKWLIEEATVEEMLAPRVQKKLTREESDRLMHELWAQMDIPEGTYERVTAEMEAIEKESLERGSTRGSSS